MSLNTRPIIALTGATGFLGSHLMAAMLTAGYKLIILGRPSKDETLEERISKLLRWFGIGNLANQLEIMEIDFLKPLLGLPKSNYEKLCRLTEQIVHCASDTSFSELRRDKVYNSNVNSLNTILEFAAKANVTLFHYISTAYVAGANIRDCKETISSAGEFLNVYEESKAEAENIIVTFCEKRIIPCTILRPSIVYGDSRTGRSLKFNALYFPLQSLKCVRDIYLNDIKNQGGKKSGQYGIFIDEEGYLFLPLRIYLPEMGALNLIPVDYFINASLKIISETSTGGIYHLTNKTYTDLELILRYNEQLMKVRGVEIIYGKSTDNLIRNPAEELFDRFIEPYRPYLSDKRIFGRENTDLETDRLNPPEFTYEIFKKCMEYAMHVNWGAAIFNE